MESSSLEKIVGFMCIGKKFCRKSSHGCLSFFDELVGPLLVSLITFKFIRVSFRGMRNFERVSSVSFISESGEFLECK